MAFPHLVQERRIGDHTYTCEPLGFVSGRRGLVRLGKTLGPALAALALAEGPTDLSALAGGFARLLEGLSEEDLVFFDNLFGPVSQCTLPDGKKPLVKDLLLGDHFAGKYAEYFAWLAFCIQTTYADFFAVALAKAGEHVQTAKASG